MVSLGIDQPDQTSLGIRREDRQVANGEYAGVRCRLAYRGVRTRQLRSYRGHVGTELSLLLRRAAQREEAVGGDLLEACVVSPMDTIATLVAGDSPTFCGPRVDGA